MRLGGEAVAVRVGPLAAVGGDVVDIQEAGQAAVGCDAGRADRSRIRDDRHHMAGAAAVVQVSQQIDAGATGETEAGVALHDEGGAGAVAGTRPVGDGLFFYGSAVNSLHDQRFNIVADHHHFGD